MTQQHEAWSRSLFQCPEFEQRVLALHSALDSGELINALVALFRYTGHADVCALQTFPGDHTRPGFSKMYRVQTGREIQWEAPILVHSGTSLEAGPQSNPPFFSCSLDTIRGGRAASGIELSLNAILMETGLRHVLGLNLFHRRRLLGIIFVARGAGQHSFQDSEKDFLMCLLPILRTALRRVEKAESNRVYRHALNQAVNDAKACLALADATGKILTATPAALSLLEKADTASIRNGHLPDRICIPCAQQADGDSGKFHLPISPETDTVLSCNWRRLPGQNFLWHFSEMSASPSPARQRRELELERMLSPAERAVLALLLSGDSNRTIAAKLGRSPHTVKVQVGSILRKTGKPGRAALIAYVAGGPASR